MKWMKWNEMKMKWNELFWIEMNEWINERTKERMNEKMNGWLVE